MAMNLEQARVVDPLITTFARGYKNGTMVASQLFPVVDVALRAGKIIEFGAGAFAVTGGLDRAPGAEVKRISFSYSHNDYAITQRALGAITPRELMEEADASTQVNLLQASAQVVLDRMALDNEVIAANLAQNPDAYADSNKVTLTGTDKWSDAASKPASVVNEAKAAIRKGIGKNPNVLVLTEALVRALQQNADVRDRIKYSAGGEVTLQTLAAYFDVETILIGNAMRGDASNFTDVWQDMPVLAYTKKSGISAAEPTFGATYRLRNYPVVEAAVWDNDTKSWTQDVLVEEVPVICGAAGGFLIQGAL